MTFMDDGSEYLRDLEEVRKDEHRRGLHPAAEEASRPSCPLCREGVDRDRSNADSKAYWARVGEEDR